MSNFWGRIADAAARHAARPAIEYVRADGRVETTTYQALVGEAGRFAGWLRDAGLAHGDRAAILADNDAHWIAAYLGTLAAGGVAVPLDTAYTSGQVRTVVESSGARVLFTTPRHLDTARAAIADRPGGSAPRLVLLAGSAPDAAGVTAPETVAAAEPAPAAADAADADAAVILYTSGTTADPKGVVLTHRNLDAERLAVLSVIDASARDAVLGVLPLFHALAQMANLLLPLSIGARVVFLETASSTSLLAALESRGITIFACVPQFFYLIHQRVASELARAGVVRRTLARAIIETNVRLRDAVGWNPGRRLFGRAHRALGPSMRVLVTGGSRFDPVIGRDLYGMGFTLLNGYGLTETSGAASLQRPGDRFTTSVGPPLPGVDVRIDDDEILLRGPIVMREYFQRPDATAEVLRDGWLRTGDLGRIDAEGRIHITGRRKEIIVLASGKNLYPEEIEAHYLGCPFIREMCVMGLSRPGEPAAERLHAVVVPNDAALRERGIVNVGELLRFEIETLSVALPAHKRILSYDISSAPLPRTTTGKLKRPDIARAARARAAAARHEERPLTAAEREWLSDPARARLAGAAAARLGRASIAPQANLELDLGLDSMERVELLTALERLAGTRVPAEVRATIFTVADLIEAVGAGAPAGDAASTPASPDDDAWERLLASEPPADLTRGLARPKPVRFFVYFCLLRGLGAAAAVGLRLRASGRAHVPRTGAFILCPNHQTFFDAAAVSARLPFHVLRRTFAVGAAEYFATPVTAWFASAANIVPVDPDANLVTAMQAAAAGLRLGKVLLLFPEGERTIDGDLKKFRKGAAILSARLGVPIVPVALDGLYDLWPRGRPFQWRRLLPWRAAPIAIRFGAPIQAGARSYADDTAELRAAVDQMLREIRAGG